ncbi:hypothetical protein DERP_005258 [Dermatophagoides pteronyssinus]|uniref:Uncharacterized protein n=1 Tax=Dermatophagoides pteronyssinus TaxID=6956 RepID=A0ABQ8JMP1_DERPT|nr:hypothetical protein DERP_005258 [Dermatophagoides pteronyssinus]
MEKIHRIFSTLIIWLNIPYRIRLGIFSQFFFFLNIFGANLTTKKKNEILKIKTNSFPIFYRRKDSNSI